MMTDIITLIKRTEAADQRRTVFCTVASVGQQEFYRAAAAGLKPEIRFILQDNLDYSMDETYAEYSGQVYRIMRVYRSGHRLELTCAREMASYNQAPKPGTLQLGGGTTG